MSHYSPGFFRAVFQANSITVLASDDSQKEGDATSGLPTANAGELSYSERLLEQYKNPQQVNYTSFLQRRAYQCLADSNLTLSELLHKIQELTFGNPALEKALVQKIIEVLQLKTGMANNNGKLLELAHALQQHYSDKKELTMVATPHTIPRLKTR